MNVDHVSRDDRIPAIERCFASLQLFGLGLRAGVVRMTGLACSALQLRKPAVRASGTV